MDPLKAALVITLALFIIVGINIVIYIIVKGSSRDMPLTMDIIRRAAKRVRNPWIVEDTMLEELADITAKLKNETGQEDISED
ncbi:MAG: hypothetical protein U9R58_08575 [Chloroflexota bacterium]|nr:hypothetical protein [Chloroflexota bacterium]